MADAVRNGKSEFNLLGQSDLAPLIAALEQAAQKTQQLAQEAVSAKSALDDVVSSLKDEIDAIDGNQTDAENRRFQKQLDDLKAQADLAGAQGRAAYNEAVALANKLHQLKLQQIADEKKAQIGNGPSNTDTGTAANSNIGLGPNTTANPNTNPLAPPPRTSPNSATANVGNHTINVNVEGSLIGAGSTAQIAEALARLVKPQLDRIANLSR